MDIVKPVFCKLFQMYNFYPIDKEELIKLIYR